MAFAFERFTETGGRYSPKVSIRSGGSFGLSQGALRHFGLEDGVWYAVFHYDKTANVIGIQPTRDNNELGAVKIVVRRYTPKNGTGAESVSCSISGKSFLDYFGIDYQKSRSFIAEKDNGFIIVRLGSPVSDDENDEDQPIDQESEPINM